MSVTTGQSRQTIFLAECIWPGVSDESVRELDTRLREELASATPTDVVYHGAVLVPEDEVLFCLFAGPVEEVHALAVRADVPMERLVPCRTVGLRL
jgi:hypothetical protein